MIPTSSTSEAHERPGTPIDPVAIADWIDDLMGVVLTTRQRHVVTRRFGIDGEPAETLALLGCELGVTRERIRQIQNQAIARLVGGVRRDPAAAAFQEFVLAQADPAAAPSWSRLAQDVWPDCSAQAGYLLYRIGVRSGASWKMWQSLVANWKSKLAEDEKAARTYEQQRRSDALFQRLLAGCWWPDAVHVGTPAALTPNRPHEAEAAITWTSSKLGRAVYCDSELERRFFGICERTSNVDWFVEQPLQLRYKFDGKEQTYVPDALIHLTDGRLVLVEVKPLHQASLLRNQAKWYGARRWCTQYGVGFLVTNCHTGLIHYLGKPIRGEVRTALSQAVTGQGALSWPEVWSLMLRLDFGYDELTRIAAADGLAVSQYPWRLLRL